MLEDVLAAIAAARAIDRTIVVSGDPAAQEIAASVAAEVIPDPADEGHVEAALAGIARAESEGAECVVLLPGDCPLLDSRELDRLLTGLPESYVAIVPDRHGEGTNALVLTPPTAIRPAFGEGSRARPAGPGPRRGARPRPPPPARGGAQPPSCCPRRPRPGRPWAGVAAPATSQRPARRASPSPSKSRRRWPSTSTPPPTWSP